MAFPPAGSFLLRAATDGVPVEAPAGYVLQSVGAGLWLAVPAPVIPPSSPPVLSLGLIGPIAGAAFLLNGSAPFVLATRAGTQLKFGARQAAPGGAGPPGAQWTAVSYLNGVLLAPLLLGFLPDTLYHSILIPAVVAEGDQIAIEVTPSPGATLDAVAAFVEVS